MFKDAGEYSAEELLRMCQDFFGGVYWAWYETSLKAVGEAGTHKILEQLADTFSELELTAMKALWGREFANLHEITRALDVVHRVVAYEGPTRGSTPEWKMDGLDKAHESISHCPIHATTPEQFKGKGPTALCNIYCHNIGQQFYGKLGYTIVQDSWLAKGQSHCGYQIGRSLLVGASTGLIPQGESIA